MAPGISEPAVERVVLAGEGGTPLLPATVAGWVVKLLLEGVWKLLLR